MKLIKDDWDAEYAFSALYNVNQQYLHEAFRRYFSEKDIQEAISLSTWEPTEYLDRSSSEKDIQKKKELLAYMDFFTKDKYLDVVEELVLEAIRRFELDLELF